MKKFVLLFCALCAGTISFAQTIPGGDMETWRDNTSGDPAVNVHAPAAWFGIDSLIIGVGSSFFPPNPTHPWNAQIFKETTRTHGGTGSAKIMTLPQDTLGYIPGILTNAQASFNLLAIITGSASNPLDAVSYSGGTPVTVRINTVSAWVEYQPGFDSGTHTIGADTGAFTIEAHGTVAGADSIVGRGFVAIPPTGTFTQVTATIQYTDTITEVNNMRFFFLSSGGGASRALDSSILYVDDVTMTGSPEVSHVGVKNVVANDAIKVYPNPATGTIFLSGALAGSTCTLFAVNGQVVATKALAGNDAIDVSGLAAGSYFYAITDATGKAIQKGNITLTK